MTEYRLNQTGAEVQEALDQVPVTQEQLQQEVSVRSETVGALDERVGNLEQNSYQKPADGIPKSDLAEGVQASLNKADNALQSQEQADWNESDSTKASFIKNKPAAPADQVNADWNASSGVAEILNKPTTIAGYGITDGYTKTEGQALESEVDDRLDAQDAAIALLNGSEVIVVADHTDATEVPNPDPQKIYREYGTNSYTDYMCVDATTTPVTWKPLATYSYPGVDNVPTADSEKLVKSGGVKDALNELGYYVEDAEWVRVVTDSEGKILAGIKADGTTYMHDLYSETVDMDWVSERLEEAIREINEEVDEKLALFPDNFENIDDTEGRIELKVDSSGNIISFRDKKGVLHENAGIESPTLDKLKVDLQEEIDTTKSELEEEINSHVIDVTDVIQRNGGAIQIASDCKAISLGKTTAPDSSALAGAAPLNFIFVSDVHGVASNLANIKKVRDALVSQGITINDTYFGGDQSTSQFSDGSFNNIWDANAGSDFIFCIGNHDTWVPQSQYDPESGDEQISNFYVKNETALYNQFYRGRIENWGVTYSENKCYFYKDYNNLIRVIVLECIHSQSYRAEQLTWLQGVLEDARQHNLHVICVEHYCPGPISKFTSQWSSVDESYGGSVTDFRDAVAEFIHNGGVFIGWLVGHTHCDIIGYVTGGTYTEKQLVFITALASNSNRSGDNVAVNNSKSQDCINYISIDTESKLFRMHRIGRNVSRYGQTRNYITVDYENVQIITES